MTMAKFTVDTANKLFIAKAGVTSFDVQTELYSAAKQHWLTDAVAIQYQFPLSSVGGDTITPTRDLGATFFLATDWKIRPDEVAHDLLVDGNLYVLGGVGSPFTDTVGAFNVRIEMFVSNLIDASKSDVDAIAAAVGVIIDEKLALSAITTAGPGPWDSGWAE